MRGNRSVIVRLPSPLRSYADEQAEVEAKGQTVDEVLWDLDRRFPGMRFRVVDEHGRLRRHIKLYIGTQASEDLATHLDGSEVLQLVAALSGG